MNSSNKVIRKKELLYQKKKAATENEEVKINGRLSTIGSGYKSRRSPLTFKSKAGLAAGGILLFATMLSVAGAADEFIANDDKTSSNGGNQNVTETNTNSTGVIHAEEGFDSTVVRDTHTLPTDLSVQRESSKEEIKKAKQTKSRKDDQSKTNEIISFRDVISVDPELEQLLSKHEINRYRNKVSTTLKRLSDLSNENKKHIDYALRSGLKIKLVPENPKNPNHYQYLGADHSLAIPIPHHLGKFKASVPNKDTFVEVFKVRALHEIQHCNMAVMNSDVYCDPAQQAQKYLQNPSALPPTLPRDPDELLKIIHEGQDFVLTEFARLLTVEKIQQETQATLFKKRKVSAEVSEDLKKLKEWRELLANYQPKRHLVVFNSLDGLAEQIKMLEQGLTIPYPGSGYTVYIDHIEEKYGRFYASGYAVAEASDKVKAFMEDTRYNKVRMPEVYKNIFAQSSFPKHKHAAEADGHTYEVTDLVILNKIYPRVVESHQKTRENSECKLRY